MEYDLIQLWVSVCSYTVWSSSLSCWGPCPPFWQWLFYCKQSSWAWEPKLLAGYSNGGKLRPNNLKQALLFRVCATARRNYHGVCSAAAGGLYITTQVIHTCTTLKWFTSLLLSVISLLFHIPSFHLVSPLCYSALCSGIPVFSLETTLGMQNIIMNCTVSSKH